MKALHCVEQCKKELLNIHGYASVNVHACIKCMKQKAIPAFQFGVLKYQNLTQLK